MQESARAAVSHIRAQAGSLGVPPTSSTPTTCTCTCRRAPSRRTALGGVTMATAIVSSLRRQPVRSDVAMTVRSRCLDSSCRRGIREKALAARRQGIRTFVLLS